MGNIKCGLSDHNILSYKGKWASMYIVHVLTNLLLMRVVHQKTAVEGLVKTYQYMSDGIQVPPRHAMTRKSNGQ